MMYYIVYPFSWLLNVFYGWFENYGLAIILFALVVKIVLFPLTMKGKKGMIQMNMLSGKAPDGEETQRFQQLSMLLFADNRTAGYLMAEMQLQKMMAEIFERLTRAAGMDLPRPQ